MAVAIPADAPVPQDDGPIAGPRNVVDGPAATPVDPALPGQGPEVTYMAVLRPLVMAQAVPCVRSAPPGLPPQVPALVGAVIEADGALRNVTLHRSSGSTELDDCLLQGFRQATFPPPPVALLDNNRQFTTPQMAFVASGG